MRLNLNKAMIGGLVAMTAATGLIASTIQSASADPVRPYAAAGSDTIQDVWNGLTNDFGAVAPDIASIDAFVVPPTGVTTGFASYVKTKSGGAWFLRPSGSTDGKKVVSAVWDGTYSHGWPGAALTAPSTNAALTHEDVDFARSSSGVGAATGTALTYIPFARDAVAIAYNPSGSLGAGLNLTTAQITELYSGVDQAGDPVVTFSAQPAVAGTSVFINGVQVHPIIPQSGSGTRSFFLSAIGVTTLAPYIADPGTIALGGKPENDGTVLVNDGDLVPFSAAQWIAQGNGKSTNTTTGLALSTVNSQVAVTGTAPTLAPGALYGAKNAGTGKYLTPPTPGVGTFNRDTYDIVPSTFLAGTTKQQALVSLLGGGINTPNGVSVIQSYGFGPLNYAGDTSKFLTGAFQH